MVGVMIDQMPYVAMIVGVLFARWCFAKNAMPWLVYLLHSSSHSAKQRYYEVYDLTDDDDAFDYFMSINEHVKTYSEFLRLHAAARPNAYVAFREHYTEVRDALLTRIFPLALLPSILFWKYWYFYLIGVGITLSIMLADELVRRRGIEFFQRANALIAINDYDFKHRKKPKATPKSS